MRLRRVGSLCLLLPLLAGAAPGWISPAHAQTLPSTPALGLGTPVQSATGTLVPGLSPSVLQGLAASLGTAVTGAPGLAGTTGVGLAGTQAFAPVKGAPGVSGQAATAAPVTTTPALQFPVSIPAGAAAVASLAPSILPPNGPPILQAVQPIGGIVTPPGAQSPQAPPAVSSLPPYGSQLFIGQPVLFGPVAYNRDYIVASGDQITIQVWGAYTYSGVQGVDPEGNIFVPQVGPIHVQGLTNRELDNRIAASVTRVFDSTVGVYASLLSKQPVAVYVSGAVRAPGRYSGDRQDSPLQYIARSGGIDPNSGSYRDIEITRAGRPIAHIDLYAFLTGKPMPAVQFEVNDTIHVGFQRPTVAVQGDVQNAYRFEVDNGGVSGGEIAALARPTPTVSNVSIQGIRNGQPYNAYLGLADFKRVALASGDTLQFTSDYVSQTIFVNVSGQSAGPSAFVVRRGARLGDVLKLIEADPAVADLDSIFLRRQSVAMQQEAALSQSLDRLRRSVLLTRSASTSDAALHTEEGTLVQEFLRQVQDFKPQGNVALPHGPERDAVLLEPFDQIVIPAKSDVVLVTGEVRLPQSLIYSRARSLDDYVSMAGGLTDRADTSAYIVLHSSGEAETGSGSIRIRPGDQIMVMPRVDAHSCAIVQDLITMIHQIAVSTGIVVRLTGL